MVGWKDWEGKKVFIELVSGRKYSGKVLLVEEMKDIYFLTIKDKFGYDVGISSSKIEVIQEEK